MPNVDFDLADEQLKHASQTGHWVIQCFRCKAVISVLRGSLDRVSADLTVYCQECYEWALEFPTRR